VVAVVAGTAATFVATAGAVTGTAATGDADAIGSKKTPTLNRTLFTLSISIIDGAGGADHPPSNLVVSAKEYLELS